MSADTTAALTPNERAARNVLFQARYYMPGELRFETEVEYIAAAITDAERRGILTGREECAERLSKLAKENFALAPHHTYAGIDYGRVARALAWEAAAIRALPVSTLPRETPR